MRAAVLRGEAGSGQLAIEDVPGPEVGPGEVRVRVRRTGICGSDVHFVLDGRARPAFTPIILGHESMGVVDEVGADVAGLDVGARVSIIPLVTCAECDRCRAGRTVICRHRLCLGSDIDGTYADHAVVPARNLVPVPPSVSDEVAAVATDSVATAYHAVATRGAVGQGSRVAVWGAGGLGLSAIAVARALGAGHIVAVDPRPGSRAWAVESGADEAYEPDEALARISAAGGVDVAFEFVGTTGTVEQAVRSLDDGGRAVVVGVGPDQVAAGRLMTFVLREREVVGSYGSEPEDLSAVLGLIDSGALRLPRLVGDVIALDEILEGMHRVEDGDTGGSRIVVAIADD